MPVNILNLPGLNVLDFKETDDEYHIKASPREISRRCPHCASSDDIVSHAWRTLVIRDIPSHGKAVAIHLDVPRLKCRPCKKTFTATVPEVDTGREMTMRLTQWVGRRALEYTYAEIAKQVKVDEKTIRNVFDEYVAELEKQFKRETPIWLGIDEIKLKRFRAIFTNLHGRSLIDMLPDRYTTSVVSFLKSLPDKERITHCAIDMWSGYRRAVQEVLPNAKIVVDKFHVVSKANAAFDIVRRKVARESDGGAGLGLKRAHKLFDKRRDDLTDEQYLTVSGWLNNFPVLAAAYDLKERLYRIYEVETPEEAWGEYLHWESTIPNELSKPFRAVKTAFRNWKPYILNYFDDQRVTNAFTESFNAKVREVYRNGRGYSFERLRAKVLYTDMFQKRVKVQERVRVRKQRFEDVTTARYMCLATPMQDDYEIQIKTRVANLGADLSTLELVFDSGKF
jgi:transposase